MKGIKKFIIYTFFVVFILSTVFFSYTYADSSENQCSACRATPVGMQMYINFEVELLGILQGASAQPETVGKNKKSGLFAGGFWSLTNEFFKSTISKAKKKMDSEAKAARSLAISAVLLYKMSLSHMWRDSVGSLSILFQDESFVRDYKILQEIDMGTNDVIRDMGIDGIWGKNISTPIQTQIIGLQTKYSSSHGGLSDIFEKLVISSDVKYKTLLSFVLELNSLMKTTLYSVGDEDGLMSKIKRFENKYSKGDIIAKLNSDRVQSIIIDYECAYNGDCNQNLIQVFTGLTNLLRNSLDKSFSNSKKTVKDANKNLAEAFGSRGNYDGFRGWVAKKQKSDSESVLTDRQVELLYNVYGIDAYELTTSQQETFKRNREKIKKEFNPLSDVLKNTKNSKGNNLDVEQNKGAQINNKGMVQEKKYMDSLTDQEKQNLMSDLLRQNTVGEDEITQLVISGMQSVVDSILLEKTSDKGITLIGTNNDTHFFVEIGEYIHSIIRDEIGDKSSDGLVDNLGKTCVYQCSNKGIKNCYYDK